LPLLAAQTVEQPVRSVTDPGVVTTRQAVTPAGVQSILQGRVYGAAFGESAAELWVLAAGQVYRLDWQANRVLERVPFKGAAGLQGIRYDAAGKRAVIAAADPARKVRLFAVSGGKTSNLAEGLGGFIAGSISVNGSRAAVPLIYDNKLAVVDLAQNPVKSIQVGMAPFGAIMDRKGTVAYVSNWGGRPPSPKDLTAPTGLAKDADRIVIDVQGKAATGTVNRVDLESGQVTHSIAVELHPMALAWDEERNRLYVANGNSDSISIIDTKANRNVGRIALERSAHPTALALAADGTLYAALGALNAVAVIRNTTVVGMIPTAWYPNALALSPDGSHLAVTTLLGAGSGWREEPRKRYVHSYRGSVAVIPTPDAAQLAAFTLAVRENNRLPMQQAAPTPPPKWAAAIEHVVYIVKENRTYDQVFGDMPKGNGDPSLVMFGERVTPNHHSMADQFVLLDNFYATGGNSGDGHQWVTQANETAYAMWPGYTGRSYPFDGSDPIAYSSGGFIWDAALKRKKTVRVYGEYVPRLNESRNADRAELLERWRKGDDFTGIWNVKSPIPGLDGVLARQFPSYSTAIPDVVRAQIFLADLKNWVAAGSMPNLVIVQLPSDHTRGTAPGTSTPAAMVADNDLAMGQIVDALSKTPFWRKMAIFIVEDDAQNGVDHVDGHRTVALVASPYARRGYVDSTFYSQPSILKTIELILGLPALSIFDLIANDMRASFQETPDFRPYDAITPTQSLFDINPPATALRGAARRAALDSMKMRFDAPDDAPTDRLNRIVWGAIRGWNTPYPPVRKSLFAPMSIDLDDDER
jgi:YVTN family beta-propeller protein